MIIRYPFIVFYFALFILLNVLNSAYSQSAKLLYDFSDSIWTNELNVLQLKADEIKPEQFNHNASGCELVFLEQMSDSILYYQIKPQDSNCCVQIQYLNSITPQKIYDKCHKVKPYLSFIGKIGGIDEGMVFKDFLLLQKGIYVVKKDQPLTGLASVKKYRIQIFRNNKLLYSENAHNFRFSDSLKQMIKKLRINDAILFDSIQIKYGTYELIAEPVNILIKP